MLLSNLRDEVYEANMELQRRGVVLYTFGNASGIDREQGLVVIKPSGVDYEVLTAKDLVVLNLQGEVVAGEMRPSSDTATHIALYNAWPEIGGVVHTHSTYATAWAQSCTDLPCFGTTHADYVAGPVPCCAPMTPEEVAGDYEVNTGQQIIHRFDGINPVHVPMVLVGGHGPFAWGKNAAEATYHAVILEELAQMAAHTLAINPNAKPLAQHILDKHWQRKHGANAYYGQS
ncbi:MAG: L-ribulose-5-phosphate 4-epimerase [Planctomycetes bacterium]|nr:L-ribulose-5-phosphate 4-epimerase [Planctomycetota bacterium]